MSKLLVNIEGHDCVDVGNVRDSFVLDEKEFEVFKHLVSHFAYNSLEYSDNERISRSIDISTIGYKTTKISNDNLEDSVVNTKGYLKLKENMLNKLTDFGYNISTTGILLGKNGVGSICFIIEDSELESKISELEEFEPYKKLSDVPILEKYDIYKEILSDDDITIDKQVTITEMTEYINSGKPFEIHRIFDFFF